MKYFFSQNEILLTWYVTDIWKEQDIPEGTVETTEQKYKEALKINANFFDGTNFIVKDFRTEDEILTQAKAEKTNKVNEDVKTLIISGFTSSALGTNHMYQSDETDQLNLIGAVTSGVAQAFKCSSNDGESWQWKMHTITQLQTVLRDGASYKNQLLENASTLKSQIQVCTTIEELEAILL